MIYFMYGLVVVCYLAIAGQFRAFRRLEQRVVIETEATFLQESELFQPAVDFMC